jgi:hypothetical protein
VLFKFFTALLKSNGMSFEATAAWPSQNLSEKMNLK